MLEQTRDNVDGTRNVVEAALARGVRRLVVTSSISAYGPVSGDDHRRDAKPRREFAASTIRAASIRRRRSPAPPWPQGLEVVVMQPGAIMGPYDIGTWSRVFVMVRDGKLPGVPPADTDLHACAGVRRRPYRSRRQGRERRQRTCSAAKIKP